MSVLQARRTPALGGYNATFLSIELQRLLRNRRTVLISIVVPVVLFLIFHNQSKLAVRGGPKIGAEILIGIAVYGSMLASTAGGAMVSIERALGWSRQLRLTPLAPVAYVAIKLTIAMVLGFVSVLAVYVVGLISGVSIETGVLVASGLLALVGAVVFAALGLFLGYLLPSENVMQFISPILGVLAFVGGLLVPINLMPPTIQDIAPYAPTYGVAAIARFPLLGGAFDWTWILNLVAWTLAFGLGAAFMFRRDTRRT